MPSPESFPSSPLELKLLNVAREEIRKAHGRLNSVENPERSLSALWQYWM